MQKQNLSCKVVSVVLTATLVAGMDAPAIVYAADTEITQSVNDELISDSAYHNVSLLPEAQNTTGSALVMPDVQNTTASALTMPLSVEAPAINDTFTTEDGVTYKVTKVATETSNGQVTLTGGKNVSGDLVLANGVSYAGGSYDIKAFDSSAFAGNTALTSIDFSQTNVNVLPANCFNGCTNLTNVKVDDRGTMNLTAAAVFSGCTSLTSLQMNRVYISSAQPFSGSSLQQLTVSELSPSNTNTPINFAFQNLPDGFTLICQNSLSAKALGANAFYNTPNATLIVPTDTLKETYTTTFAAATNVTVKTLNEGDEEAIALVTSANGTVLGGYATLSNAIAAINQANGGAPYTITMKNTNNDYVQWTDDIAPNKETVINFANKSVNLPDTLTLQAPLTIKNVTNVDTNDGLCALDAGEYPFTMINGGSYGFSQIKGNDITIDGVLPGSVSMGAPCQWIGTGDHSSLTIKNIGRSNYYYNLPSMQDFATLFLNNSYLEVKDGDSALKDTTVALQKGGLQLDGALTVDGLTGTGEIRFAKDTASLIITHTADGDFQLPDITAEELAADKISLPKDNSASFVNQSGTPVTIAEPVVTVSNLGGFSSLEAALSAIENGTEDAYTITLLGNAALPHSGTEGKFYRLDLPAKKITIDGKGYRLSGMGNYQAYTNNLYVNGDLTFKNVNLQLGDTVIYCNNAVDVVITDSATGTINTLEDTAATDGSHFYVRPNVQMSNVNGNTKTVMTMTGYGSKEAPAPQYDTNYKKVYPYPALAKKAMSKTILDHSWLSMPNDGTWFGDLEIPEAGGLATSASTQTPTIQGLLVADGADASVQLTYNTTWKTLYSLKIKGNITGSTAVSVTGGTLTEGQTIVKAETSGDANSFYLIGNNDFVLQKDGTAYKTAKPAVSDITLDQSSLTLEAGKTATLVATVTPDNAADKTVTWSSSDKAVATVDEAGNVTAVGAGTATITAEAGEKTATCTVTVTPEVIAVSDITLDQSSLTLEAGKTATLVATVTPDNAADKTVTWSSSDEAVATVDEAGNVTAVGAGTATITAQAGEKTATCTVTVTPEVIAVSDITLDQSSLTLEAGKTATLVATVTPDNATDKTVTWSSSDKAVATVDTNGKVTAVGAGTATITAQAGEKTATCEVTVSKASSSGSSSGGSFSGSYNYPVQITDADNATVTMDKSSATAGETVTLTVKPEAGQKVDEVTVTDSAGNKITTKAEGDNRYSFVMPNGSVKVAVATVPAAAGSATATQIQMQIGSKQVLVGNTAIQCDATPLIQNNRTLVPVRMVVEAFGGNVDWDGRNRVVTMQIAGRQLSLTIGETISGYDVAPIIINGRTYVPIRYIAETLGASVTWNEDSQQVVITKTM